MSDERLSALERRWRETGAIEDEAACLTERLRVGRVTGAELFVEAIGGSAGASLALNGGVTAMSAADVRGARREWTKVFGARGSRGAKGWSDVLVSVEIQACSGDGFRALRGARAEAEFARVSDEELMVLVEDRHGFVLRDHDLRLELAGLRRFCAADLALRWTYISPGEHGSKPVFIAVCEDD